MFIFLGMKIKNLPFFCILLIGLWSCTPQYNPSKTYPDFKIQSKNFEQAFLAVDAVVIENTRKRSTLDYDRQELVAKSFHDEFLKLLSKKEIKIDDTFYGSSGLFFPKEYEVEVQDVVSDSSVIDSGIVLAPPFYLSESLKDDPLMVEEILISIQDTLAWERDVEEDYNPNELLFVCIIEGVNTPVGKQFGQAFATALLSLGSTYMYQTSYLVGELYIFDIQTGRLLWYDERSAVGDLANKRTASLLAKNFSQKIPPEYVRSVK